MGIVKSTGVFPYLHSPRNQRKDIRGTRGHELSEARITFARRATLAELFPLPVNLTRYGGPILVRLRRARASHGVPRNDYKCHPFMRIRALFFPNVFLFLFSFFFDNNPEHALLRFFKSVAKWLRTGKCKNREVLPNLIKRNNSKMFEFNKYC